MSHLQIASWPEYRGCARVRYDWIEFHPEKQKYFLAKNAKWWEQKLKDESPDGLIAYAPVIVVTEDALRKARDRQNSSISQSPPTLFFERKQMLCLDGHSRIRAALPSLLALGTTVFGFVHILVNLTDESKQQQILYGFCGQIPLDFGRIYQAIRKSQNFDARQEYRRLKSLVGHGQWQGMVTLRNCERFSDAYNKAADALPTMTYGFPFGKIRAYHATRCEFVFEKYLVGYLFAFWKGVNWRNGSQVDVANRVPLNDIPSEVFDKLQGLAPAISVEDRGEVHRIFSRPDVFGCLSKQHQDALKKHILESHCMIPSMALFARHMLVLEALSDCMRKMLGLKGKDQKRGQGCARPLETVLRGLYIGGGENDDEYRIQEWNGWRPIHAPFEDRRELSIRQLWLFIMRQDNPASVSQAHLAWMAKQLGFHSSQIEEHAAKHCSAATETPHLPTWTDSSDVPLDERLGQKAERWREKSASARKFLYFDVAETIGTRQAQQVQRMETFTPLVELACIYRALFADPFLSSPHARIPSADNISLESLASLNTTYAIPRPTQDRPDYEIESPVRGDLVNPQGDSPVARPEEPNILEIDNCPQLDDSSGDFIPCSQSERGPTPEQISSAGSSSPSPPVSANSPTSEDGPDDGPTEIERSLAVHKIRDIIPAGTCRLNPTQGEAEGQYPSRTTRSISHSGVCRDSTTVGHKRLQWQGNHSASVTMSDGQSPTEQETRISPFTREPSSTSVFNKSIGSDVHYPLIPFHQDSHSGANPGQTMADHARLQWQGNHSASVTMSDGQSPTEQETRISPFTREPSPTSVVNNSIGSDVHYPLILFHQDSHSGANPSQTMVDHKRLQWQENRSASVIMSDGGSPTEQETRIGPFRREPSSTSVVNNSIGSDVHYPLILFHQDSHSGANPGQTMVDHKRLQWHGNCSPSVASLNREVVRVQEAQASRAMEGYSSTKTCNRSAKTEMLYGNIYEVLTSKDSRGPSQGRRDDLVNRSLGLVDLRELPIILPTVEVPDLHLSIDLSSPSKPDQSCAKTSPLNRTIEDEKHESTDRRDLDYRKDDLVQPKSVTLHNPSLPPHSIRRSQGGLRWQNINAGSLAEEHRKRGVSTTQARREYTASVSGQTDRGENRQTQTTKRGNYSRSTVGESQNIGRQESTVQFYHSRSLDVDLQDDFQEHSSPPLIVGNGDQYDSCEKLLDEDLIGKRDWESATPEDAYTSKLTSEAQGSEANGSVSSCPDRVNQATVNADSSPTFNERRSSVAGNMINIADPTAGGQDHQHSSSDTLRPTILSALSTSQGKKSDHGQASQTGTLPGLSAASDGAYTSSVGIAAEKRPDQVVQAQATYHTRPPTGPETSPYRHAQILEEVKNSVAAFVGPKQMDKTIAGPVGLPEGSKENQPLQNSSGTSPYEQESCSSQDGKTQSPSRASMQKLPTGGKDHPSNTNWQAPYIENVDETYEDDAGSSPQESCSGAPTTLSASEEVDPPIDVVAPTEPTVIPGQSTETPAGTTASPMPESIQNRRSTVPPAVSHQGPSVEDVDDPREGGAESKVQRSDSHAPTTHSASKEATPPGEALAPTESTVISGQPAEPPREAAATTESTIISGQPAEPPREAAAPSESTVIPGQPAETPKETAAPHTPESIQNRRSTVPPAIGHQDPSVEDIDETLEKGAESTQQRSDSRAPTTRPASTELDPLRKATTPAESTVISGQPAETTARPTASPTPESIQTHKSTVLPAVSHQDPSVEGIEETHKDGTEPTVQPSVNRAPTAHSASSIKVDPPREAAASAEPTVIPGQSAEAPAGTTASHTPESIQNQQSTVPPAISHQGPSVEGVDDPRDGGAESTVQRSDSHAPTTHSASKEANPPREALAPTESTVISGQPAEPPREAAAPTDSTVISGQPAEPSGESAAPPKPESTRNQSTVPRAVSHQGPSVEDIDEPHEDDAEPTVPGQPAETPGETAVPPKPESIQNQPSTVPPAIGHQGPSVEDVDETHKDGTEPTVQRSDNRAPTAHSASSIKVDPPREAAASAEPTVIPGQSAETPAGTTASHTPEPIQTHQSTVPRAVSHQGPSVEDIDEPHEDDAEPTVQRSDKRPPTTHSASKEANPPREAAAPAESTIIPDQPAEPSGGSAAPPKPESIQIPRSPTPPGHNRPNQPACPRDAGKGAGTDQSPSIGVNKPKSPKVQKPKQLLGKRRRGTAPESWVPKRPCIESPKAQQRGLMNWARDRQRKVPASLDGSRLYGPRTVAFVAEFAAFVRNLAASADAHIASDAVPQANGDHMGSSLPAANTEATQRTPLHGNIPRDEASPGSAEQHRMLESMYVFGTAEMSFDTTHPQPLSQHPNTAPASDVHPVLSEEPSITIQSTDSLGSKPTEDLAAQTLDTEQTVQQSGDTSFCGTGPNEDSSAQAPHIVTQEASQDLDCDQPMQEPAPNQRMPVHDESRTESPSLSAQRPKLATYIPPVEVSSTPSSPVVFPAPTTRESAPNPDISVSESANSVDLIQDLNGAQQNGTGQHLNTFIKSKKRNAMGTEVKCGSSTTNQCTSHEDTPQPRMNNSGDQGELDHEKRDHIMNPANNSVPYTNGNARSQGEPDQVFIPHKRFCFGLDPLNLGYLPDSQRSDRPYDPPDLGLPRPPDFVFIVELAGSTIKAVRRKNRNQIRPSQERHFRQSSQSGNFFNRHLRIVEIHPNKEGATPLDKFFLTEEVLVFQHSSHDDSNIIELVEKVERAVEKEKERAVREAKIKSAAQNSPRGRYFLRITKQRQAAEKLAKQRTVKLRRNAERLAKQRAMKQRQIAERLATERPIK